MQRPARGIEIFWWCLQRWIYMWRPGGGMEICRAGTPWHVPASWICRLSQEEWNSDVSSPGFMRVRKSKSDKSGQVGTCQVWFLSKRGGSVATLGTTPAHPYLLSDLNEGTTNREMASPQSQTEQDNQPSPCVASMSAKMAHTWIIS